MKQLILAAIALFCMQSAYSQTDSGTALVDNVDAPMFADLTAEEQQALVELIRSEQYGQWTPLGANKYGQVIFANAASTDSGEFAFSYISQLSDLHKAQAHEIRLGKYEKTGVFVDLGSIKLSKPNEAENLNLD